MPSDLIAHLIQLLRDAPDLGSIEVRRGFWGLWSSVRVSRQDARGAGDHHVVVAAPPPAGAAPAAAAAPTPGAPAAPPGPAAPALLEIKSPMVGTFYRSPEPGAEAYVKPGSRVAPGQVVCIIEAMKIMNEIEAEIAGVIRDVLAENAQPVEFGQPLFRVDPHG
jgi:acetyl-CoA carboxylase biotin carboxyl carrier protein